MALTAQHLQDAEWHPTSVLAKARTGVAIGSGMSATTELFKASQSIAAGQPRRSTDTLYLSQNLQKELYANLQASLSPSQSDYHLLSS